MNANDNSYLRWAVGVWWLVWIFLQSAVLYLNQIALRTAITDALISIGTLLVSGFAMMNLMRFYRPGRGNRLTFVLAPLAITLLTYFVQQNALTNIFADDLYYVSVFRKTWLLRAVYDLLMVGFVVATSALWFYLKDQTQSEARLREAEKLAREAELSGLRQQLNPHFLFNSLNSVNALIGSRPDEARRMIQQLSDFLRGTVKVDARKLIPLQDEMSHLALYLDIERVRFGHRLDVEVALSESSKSMSVPALLLQPVVENAIKFGLYDNTGAIQISIRAEVSESMLHITVENPFDRDSSSAKTGSGFGLAAVARRLELLYLRNDLLRTHQQNDVFVTTISIPV